MIDKNYLLEHITEEQILNILARFGAVPYGPIKEKEIWFQTICHGGDSNKLCYFRDTKLFHCYTNCGQMSLFGLVMRVKNCTFLESINFVARVIGFSNRYGFNNTISIVGQELQKIDKYICLRKSKKIEIKHLSQINDKILSYFERDVFYSGWLDEGITIETMQYFGICWYELEKHIIIPHYNMYGELIGIRRRSLQEKDKNNKYMPERIEGIEYGHSLSLNLYGLDKHKKGILKTKKVVIAESEKSVMLAHDYYGENAFVVATCGFNISNWQRDVLLQLGIEEVILAFDKDYLPQEFEDFDEESSEYKGFLRYIKRIYSLAYKFTAFCRTYVIWDDMDLLEKKDSPFDKGKEVLEILMRHKVEISTEREDEE